MNKLLYCYHTQYRINMPNLFHFCCFSAKEVIADTYYILVGVVNKLSRRVIIIPDDNEPTSGFVVEPISYSQITKTVHAKQAVTFTAIDAESNSELLLNGKENMTLVPWLDKNHTEVFIITSGKVQG